MSGGRGTPQIFEESRKEKSPFPDSKSSLTQKCTQKIVTEKIAPFQSCTVYFDEGADRIKFPIVKSGKMAVGKEREISLLPPTLKARLACDSAAPPKTHLLPPSQGSSSSFPRTFHFLLFAAAAGEREERRRRERRITSKRFAQHVKTKTAKEIRVQNFFKVSRRKSAINLPAKKFRGMSGRIERERRLLV